MPCLAVSHFDVTSGRRRSSRLKPFPRWDVTPQTPSRSRRSRLGSSANMRTQADQVHGIITYGGAAPNIVPARAEAKYYVRAATLRAARGVGAADP